MSLEISPETQARLAGEAQTEGVSVDVLLRRFMDEHEEGVRGVVAVQNCLFGILALKDRFTVETFTTMSVEPGIIDP